MAGVRTIQDPGPQQLTVLGISVTLTLLQLVEHHVDTDQRFVQTGFGDLAAGRIRAAFAKAKGGPVQLDDGDHDLLCASLLSPTQPLMLTGPQGRTIGAPRLQARLKEAILAAERGEKGKAQPAPEAG